MLSTVISLLVDNYRVHHAALKPLASAKLHGSGSGKKMWLFICRDVSHGDTMFTSPASPSLSIKLGRSVEYIYGYAVTEDFHLISTKRMDGFTASEDISLSAELDSDISSMDEKISFECYTDGTYEYSFDSMYASMFNGVMSKGLFSFVDTKFQLTSDGGSTWHDYNPYTDSILNCQTTVMSVILRG